MMRTVARIVRDPEDMADAFQNALVLIWKDFDKISRHPNPHAYMVRLCASVSYDMLRKRGRQRKREVAGLEEQLVAAGGSSGCEALQLEGTRIIMEALSRLSPNQSEVFYMREVEGFSFEEIAEALACSETTTRVHLSKAKSRLREILKDYAD